MRGPLSDILVLDLGQGVAPAYCTRLLADFGARVVMVEPPAGVRLRREGPFHQDRPGPERGALFHHLARGKESITLDLRTGTGRALFLRLAERADAVVEDFPPDTLDALGLGYGVLAERNPGLVLCSITWFGQTGPYRDWQGEELIAYAFAGYLYLTGLPEREPVVAGGRQSQYQAGLAGAIALLSALLQRDLTGLGQRLDVSVAEAMAMAFDGVDFYNFLQHFGEVPRRRGARLLNRGPTMAYPSTLLPAKGGWVHAHSSPSIPEGLALLTGNPRLADPDLLAEPMGHADEIDALLVEWLKDHTPDEVQERAQSMRIPFTKVQTVAEALEDPQNTAMGFFRPVEHPETGALRYPGSPMHLSETPPEPFRPPPALGEHNARIYGDLLGLAPEDLARLRAMGVI